MEGILTPFISGLMENYILPIGNCIYLMVLASVLFRKGKCSPLKRILERVLISLEMLEVLGRLAVENINVFRIEQFCPTKEF